MCIGRVAALLAVITLTTWSCSDDDSAVVAASSSGDGSQFDYHAQSACPHTISSHRLSGGRLVAAYDVTFAEAQALIPDDSKMESEPAPAAAAVVCWYEDTTLTPPMGAGDAETDAAMVYVDDQIFAVRSVDGPPERP